MSLKQRCEQIDLLVLDVDGVLTAGGIVYDSHDIESKVFHVRDGMGLAVWQRAGKLATIITGRTSAIVTKRAKELKFAGVHQGVHDKKEVLEEVLAEQELTPESVCYVGDDLADLEAMGICGLAVAPADGAAEVRATAHYVTRLGGGQGAVREAIELILRCQGHWPSATE